MNEEVKLEIINELEETRKKFYPLLIISFSIIVILGITYFFLIFFEILTQPFSILVVFGILVFISSTIMALVSFFRLKSLKKEFKTKLLKKIVEEFDGMKYSVEKRMSKKMLDQSLMFKDNITNIKGEDRFHGNRGITHFGFSQLNLYTVFPNEEEESCFFSGLFFVLTSKVPFKDSVLINNYYKKRVYYNDALSHKLNDKTILYSYTKNITDSETIKNYDLLKKLASGVEAFNNSQISIHINNNRLYLLVNSFREYFEVNVRKKITAEKVDKIFNEIIQCLLLIDTIDEINRAV